MSGLGKYGIVSINVNGLGNPVKRRLFADDIIVYLPNPVTAFPKLLDILKDYGRKSGYKLNISMTQILAINYKPKLFFTKAGLPHRCSVVALLHP
uniref:Reverse transcriptase domain-containing protein n=1 Tax=Oryzias latipes TaxID=8090 RepID=A0A3P9I4M0_ORYLA